MTPPRGNLSGNGLNSSLDHGEVSGARPAASTDGATAARARGSSHDYNYGQRVVDVYPVTRTELEALVNGNWFQRKRIGDRIVRETKFGDGHD